MKTRTFSFSWLISLLLSTAAMLPLNVGAQNFTPDLFPGQSIHREDLEIEATVNVGDFGQATNTKSWVKNLTSTNENVVRTYNQNGYTAVLIVGIGSATVEYDETMFNSDESGSSSGGSGGGVGGDGSAGGNGEGSTTGVTTHHIIHYTVIMGAPEAYYIVGNEPITSSRLIWDGNPDHGYSFDYPELVIAIKEVYLEQGVFPKFRDKHIYAHECTLESTNPNVATVTARGVTPVSYGKTTIRATWPGNTNWTSISAEYELSVEAPKQNVYVNFYQTEVTGFVGESMTALPNVQMLTIDRWQSENPQVASVDEQTGNVQFLSKGTTRIFAYVNETDEHYAAMGFYTVNVKKRTPELSFSESIAYGEPNVPFTPPTLINTNNVPIAKWYSNATNVAEVNETTGEVTIKGEGDAYIFCESSPTETFEANVASYMLHVATIGLQVMGIEVSSLNADDILGDGSKKVTFNKQNRTLNLNNWVVDASGIGDANVRQHVIWNHSKEPLTINPIGECTISNADGCIVSTMGALIFKSDSKDGILTLTANETTQSIAVQANAVKIHECNVTAIGSVVGMKLGSLTVSKQSHVYGEASETNAYAGIVCGDEFLIADEGIQILTPGVHFDMSKKTFFDDEANTVISKIVEIGKVPVTVSSDKETTIEFNMTDPNDNDVVVFSSSGNDTYNEETGQLEISTTLTDEQVATALETLIPGSSAWMSMLPGSLVFDIPAGKGEILVNCMTVPGYTLNIMINGQGAVSITQESFGWAKVTYNVTVPTHVVIYLHASSSSSARRASSSKANAYIQSIKISPENKPTAVSSVKSESTADGKYLQNGHIIIVRNGRVFNVTGVEVKHNK